MNKTAVYVIDESHSSNTYLVSGNRVVIASFFGKYFSGILFIGFDILCVRFRCDKATKS